MSLEIQFHKLDSKKMQRVILSTWGKTVGGEVEIHCLLGSKRQNSWDFVSFVLRCRMD